MKSCIFCRGGKGEICGECYERIIKERAAKLAEFARRAREIIDQEGYELPPGVAWSLKSDESARCLIRDLAAEKGE